MAIRTPEISVGLGLATATLVYAVYAKMPNQADIRVGKPGDEALETTRKQSVWTAAAIVAGISLLTKDATVFIIGGSMVVVLDFLTRANNYTDPIQNSVSAVQSFARGDEGAATEPSVDYGALQAVN
jgi:hypothetical protein